MNNMIITQSPLEINQEQALKHLALLGYKNGDRIFLRKFPPKGVKGEAKKFDHKYPDVPKLQALDGGLYFVVNGGGHSDSDVSQGQAVFFEHDDRPIEDQLLLWQSAGLPEPTAQVGTRKSVHTYYAIVDECSAEDWRELQQDLLELVDGDRTLKNPSRVMRLAGAWHIKAGEEPIQCSLLHEGPQYSYAELRAAIPRRAQKPKKPVGQLVELKPKAFTEVGSTNLVEILNREILPQMQPTQLYNWPGHNWEEDRSGNKLRGACPWHDSQSGTAFHIEPNGANDEWLWHCPSCNIGGGAVEYRDRLRGGNGSPKGKDWVAVVQELANEAGVTLPESKPGKDKAKRRTKAEVDAIADGSPLWWVPEIIDYQTCDVEHDKQGNTLYFPLTNFTLKIERILRFPKDGTRLNSDENDGGYVFRVDRKLGDRVQSDTVTIRSTELTKNLDFANALKRRLGENITSTLDWSKLQHLIHYLETQYYLAGGKRYKLADRFGQQTDGTWVFENIQFTADGKITTEDESGWVFNPDISSDEHIPSPKMLPPNAQALKRLIDAASSFYPVQSLPYVLFCLGWAMMHANYQQVFKEEKFFPALNIAGEIGQGKTIMLTLIASLFGSEHLATKFTESMVYELLKRYGSMPVLLDDPIPPGKKGAEVKDKLDDCVWKAYNGHARIVRGNHQKPHSSLAIASNKGIGASGNTAVDTRMISVNWPSCGAVNPHAWPSLQDAMSKASGAFPTLICEYKRSEVDSLTTQLIAAMPRSHGRMAKNLALLVWFTQLLCDRAGVAFNALEECKALLVPSADDLESGRSSLQDFIEYLKLLKSEGKLGEHVAVPTTRREDNQQFVAVYLQAVWGEIEARYSPNFGLPGLKTLVTEAGGYQGTAKFVDDRVAWDDYLREKHAYYRNAHSEGVQPPQKPPRNAARKALFIPADLLKDDEPLPSNRQVTEVTKSNQEAVTSEMEQYQGLQTTITTSNQSNQETNIASARASRKEKTLPHPSFGDNNKNSKGAYVPPVTSVTSVTSDLNQDTVKVSEVTTSSYSLVTSGYSPVTSTQLDAIAPGMRVWWGLDAVLWVVESVEGDRAHIRTLKGDRPPAPVPLSELRKVAA